LNKYKNIVVFDFDGTLLKKDSIKLYCKWLSFNIIEYYLIYHVWFRFLKIFNSKLDLKFERVKFYYKRHKEYNFDIQKFNNILSDNLFEDSLEILKINKSKFDIYIISASFYEIISSFCLTQLGVNLISNNLKAYNTLNDINYKNKVLALNLDIKNDYKIVKAYGNSSGDYDFMRISKIAYLRKKSGENIIWQK
jgi:phosphoserine phosphatase